MDWLKKKAKELKEEMGPSAPRAPALTDAEREERRAAMLAATERRGNDWDRRLQDGRKARAEEKRRQDERFASADGERGGTAAAAAAASAASIAHLAPLPEPPARQPSGAGAAAAAGAPAAMPDGFNPYQTQISSSTTARNAITLGAVGPAPGFAEPGPAAAAAPPTADPELVRALSASSAASEAEQADDALDAREQAEMAVAIALSAPASAAASGVAFSTVARMLRKVLENPTEPKFRQVKADNAKFAEKVATPAGGLDMLAAGGFQREGQVWRLPGTVPLTRVAAVCEVAEAAAASCSSSV